MSATDLPQSPNYKRGVELVREMLGEPFLAGMQAAAGSGAFAADTATIAFESAFGAVWSRPGLDRKTRSLITLAALTAMVRPNQLRIHVRGALANGATREEIREVLLHTVVYAGVPAGVEAFTAAAEVFNDIDSK